MHSTAEERLRGLESERGAMLPQLEQLRWQARQSERRLDEVQAAQRNAVLVRLREREGGRDVGRSERAGEGGGG